MWLYTHTHTHTHTHVYFKRILKSEIGITLIALIVTIIILMILTGVVVATIGGNNGILNRTKTAKEQYENEQEKEKIVIGKAENEIESYINNGRDSVVPTGILNINKNGIYDISKYEKVNVNVSIDVNSLVNLLNDASNAIIDKGLIPQLTSNAGSNGQAFCNTPIYTTNYDAYKAFNRDLTGNDCQNWASYVLTGNYGYVGYTFNEATEANAFYVNTKKSDGNTGVCMKEFVLQGSNDGNTWIDLTDVITHPVQTVKFYTITKNQGKYKSYRLYGKSAGAYSLVAIHELQLFNF